MGCTRSAIVATEVETLRLQVQKSEKESKNQSIQISELQREIEKAKKDAMTLSEENQKLTFQLHCRKNEEGYQQILNAEFESNKEEFQRVKLWSEFEILHANQVLAQLLENSDLPANDERRVRISFLLPQIASSQYDMEHLLALSEQRYEHIQALLTGLFHFKDTLKIQVKSLDHLVVAALKEVGKAKAAELAKSISSADTLSKLPLIRSVVKAFGLSDGSNAVRDEDREMELEGEVVTLKMRCNFLEAEVKRLQSIIEDAQQQTTYDEEESGCRPGPLSLWFPAMIGLLLGLGREGVQGYRYGRCGGKPGAYSRPRRPNLTFSLSPQSFQASYDQLPHALYASHGLGLA